MDPKNIVLNVNGIEVIYNHVILFLKGVSLQVPEGGIVAILGGNGAGKTTTLRAVSKLPQGQRGLPPDALDPCAQPVCAQMDVAPLRVDFAPALQGNLHLPPGITQIVGGVAAVPIFAQHDRAPGQVSTHHRPPPHSP